MEENKGKKERKKEKRKKERKMKGKKEGRRGERSVISGRPAAALMARGSSPWSIPNPSKKGCKSSLYWIFRVLETRLRRTKL